MNVSHLLAALKIGFEEIDDGLWEFFAPVWLGRFHEELGAIIHHLGRSLHGPHGQLKNKALPVN